jgi:hypothetical protein
MITHGDQQTEERSERQTTERPKQAGRGAQSTQTRKGMDEHAASLPTPRVRRLVVRMP